MLLLDSYGVPPLEGTPLGGLGGLRLWGLGAWGLGPYRAYEAQQQHAPGDPLATHNCVRILTTAFLSSEKAQGGPDLGLKNSKLKR